MTDWGDAIRDEVTVEMVRMSTELETIIKSIKTEYPDAVTALVERDGQQYLLVRIPIRSALALLEDDDR